MRFLLASVLFTFSQLSFALYEGKVIALEMGPSYGNIVYVNIDGSQDDRPVCATNTNEYDYAFDSSTSIGEKVFTVLYEAQKNSIDIIIRGTGTCNVGRGVEDIRWIQSK